MNRNKIIDLSVGHPTIFKRYWISQKKLFDFVYSDRLHYYHPANCFQLLEKIKKMHQLVNNFKHLDYNIIFSGGGATSLLSAAIFAFKNYYGVHNVTVFEPTWFEMYSIIGTNHCFLKNQKSSFNLKEDLGLAVVPNNPDHEYQQNINFFKKFNYLIYDFTYNWPGFFQNKKCLTVSGDVNVFTASKFLGIPDLRVGWAFVKNIYIFELMKKYIKSNNLTLTSNQKDIFLNILNYELNNIKTENYSVFDFVFEVLHKRWHHINKIKSNSWRAINSYGPFLLLRFAQQKNAEKFFLERGISCVGGLNLGSTGDTARINLLCDDEDFLVVLNVLKNV